MSDSSVDRPHNANPVMATVPEAVIVALTRRSRYRPDVGRGNFMGDVFQRGANRAIEEIADRCRLARTRPTR